MSKQQSSQTKTIWMATYTQGLSTKSFPKLGELILN